MVRDIDIFVNTASALYGKQDAFANKPQPCTVREIPSLIQSQLVWLERYVRIQPQPCMVRVIPSRIQPQSCMVKKIPSRIQSQPCMVREIPS
jgi:hypothetical protein